MRRINKQKGFTIIELVVVILLLGILTATALPRFMDVTTQAHTAVVDGVQTGISTANALFRAQWYAEKQPLTAAVNASGFNLFANSAGYPIGDNAVLTDAGSLDGTECLSIYNSLLQQGRPTAAAIQYSATAATLETNIEAVSAANTILVAASSATPATGCNFYYVGQYKNGNATTTATIPYITYTFATGAVGRSNLTLNQN